MAFILIRSTSPEATSTEPPAEEAGQSSDVRGRHGGFPPGKSIPMPVLVADLLGDHYQQQEQQSRPHRVATDNASKGTFKVPVSGSIYESNIHNLLKNRQVVVRN